MPKFCSVIISEMGGFFETTYKVRSSLMTAARQGVAFSVRTGRPVSWNEPEPSVSWYALTLAYTAARWPYAAPTQRRSIAETLTDATEVMRTRSAHSGGEYSAS